MVTNLQKEAGAALIIFSFILALTITAFSLNVINDNTLKAEQNKRTDAVLSEAKAALIGWSVANAAMPGTLPCPDNTNSGSSGSCSASTAIGRFPWKTIGLGDLRDGSGECLWYALSPVFRNTIAVASRGASQPALNSLTAGSITILNEHGNAFPVPINPVIAVIFAPGLALQGQIHDDAGAFTCKGNTLPGNYLDIANGINNATGNYGGGNNYIFTLGKTSTSFNDRLIYITAEDLYKPLRKRIGAEILGTSQPTYGLAWYYQNPINHAYPWSANTAGIQQAGVTSGYLPYPDMNFVTSIGSWLTNNAWFSLIRYQVAADFQPGTIYPQKCIGNCLTVRGELSQAAVSIEESGVTKWITRVCSVNPVVMNCPLL